MTLLAGVVPAAGRRHREGPLRRAGDDVARVEGAWALLVRTLADLGIEAPPGSTPRRAAAHHADALALHEAADAGEALARAVQTLETVRYAAVPGQVEPETMRHDVGVLLARARGRAPLRRRIAVALWPRSGREHLRGLAAGAVARLARQPVRESRTMTS